MSEDEILNIINSNNIPELLGKMKKFYPIGFDIEKIDLRIKEKILELENHYHKYNNSEILDEPRRINK